MKKERSLSVDLMAELRRQHRGSKIFKHSDRFTRGVPDISISWLGGTYWLEDKFRRKGQTLKQIMQKRDQLVSCHELSTSTSGRCWYVIYDEYPKRTTIWIPRVLARHLMPRLVLDMGPHRSIIAAVGEQIAQPMPSPQYVVGDGTLSLKSVILEHGAIWTEGWSHALVARLIYDWTKHTS